MEPKNATTTTTTTITTQITSGVEAVVVGGTTGEGQLMSWDEHVMLIAHTVHFCAQNGDTMKVRASGNRCVRERKCCASRCVAIRIQ